MRADRHESAVRMTDRAFRFSTSLARALAGDPVRVGTENRAKLAAVRAALASFADAPDALMLLPAAVESGVPEQPIGLREIAHGARNRARAALESGACALAVGIEDGLVRLADDEPEGSGLCPADEGWVEIRSVYNLGCAWVTDGEREGHAFSSAFAYPPECLEPAWRDRAPIGDLFDALWRSHREPGPGGAQEAVEGVRRGPADECASGRSSGNIGMLTQGRLDRSAYGAQAIVCALVRFLHTDLYD
ncbi:MAG: hypothetical protein CL908_22435 [Deltaproteobacteria bacterium]|jgi:non-canonical (house-cleaning) NTP pyrophosphatase|nr:hypothetical protein [Deltaproteobacteria bacterium]